MLYTYKPSNVKCYVFGVELKGLSKDTFVTIERIDPYNTFRKAQDGSHTAFLDPNGDYRVTLNIEQVSEANEFLHTVMKLQQRANTNIKIPLRVQETTRDGGASFVSFDTFFETEPMTEFSRESLSRPWSFVCHNASHSIRGTADSSFITDGLRYVIRFIELSNAAGLDLSDFEEILDQTVEKADAALNKFSDKVSEVTSGEVDGFIGRD